MALQPRIARAVSRLRGQLRRLQQVGRAEVEEAVGRVVISPAVASRWVSAGTLNSPCVWPLKSTGNLSSGGGGGWGTAQQD